MKKLISLVLIISILTCSCLALGSIDAELVEPVNAIGLTEVEMESITSLICAASAIAEDLGLANRDFSVFEVGQEIPVYEYVSFGVKQLDFSYYPILDDGEIVMLIAMMRDGSGDASLHNALTDVVNEYWIASHQVTLIQGAEGCYAYDGEKATLIREEYSPYRSSMENISVFEFQAVSSSTIDQKTVGLASSSVEATSATTASVDEYPPVHSPNLMNVPYFSQYVTYRDAYGTLVECQNLCWAACIKMMTHYVYGTSDSVLTIAQNEHGTVSFDNGLESAGVMAVLYEDYDIPLRLKTMPYEITFELIYDVLNNTENDENVIPGNINFPIPIHADFTVDITQNSTIQHATVIRGTEKYASGRTYVYMMDPACGSTIASYNTAGELFYLTSTNCYASISSIGCYDSTVEW